MRVAIVGAGAMGCLFAARLKASESEVLLVQKDLRTVSEIRRRGLRLRELNGRSIKVRVPIVHGPTDLETYDLVIFAVKAYSTAEAAEQYGKRVGPDASVLTLQNGLGNVEALSRYFGAGRVVAGSTTEGSLLLGPGSVAHTGKGKTVIGELDGSLSLRSSEIVGTFRNAGFQASTTRNVKGAVWSKAIVNSAVNPISALTRLRNGELVDKTGLRSVMLAVLEEGARVARRERVRLEPRDPAPFLFRTLRATGRNMSSMLQDVLNGRRTEIGELNGAFMERGGRIRVPTPCNEVLFMLVRGLEQGYL